MNSRSRTSVSGVLLALGIFLFSSAGHRVHASHEGDLIGGNDVVPINPEFSPAISVPGILANIVNLGGAGPPPANVQIAQQLGAAISQSISGANRPSVLTPFAGQLGSTEDEIPIFDSFGSLVANKATTIGKGNLGVGISFQHSRFTEFKGDPIGKALNSTFTSAGSSSTANLEC